ncbi:MAG: DUF2892 domain-containing protein [Sedimenticola sp.]
MFVSANLLQSGFTNICPLSTILKKWKYLRRYPVTNRQK